MSRVVWCFYVVNMLVFAPAVSVAQFVCPQGTTQVTNGSVTMCKCPDGSPASIYGCSYSNPNWTPPPPPARPPQARPEQHLEMQDPALLRRMKMFEFVSGIVTKDMQAYSQQVGGLANQLPQGKISTPPNAEAARAIAALISKPPPGQSPSSNRLPALQQNGSIVDPFTGRQVELKPPAQSPSTTARPATGSYAACAGNSTFGGASPAYCEIGGTIYFKNGAILSPK